MDLSERLTELFEGDEDYLSALRVAKNNSEGGVWLIGGAVYRTLLFGDCDQAKDYDFVVEEIHKDLWVPGRYQATRNRFGSVKLVSLTGEMDLILLRNIYQIKSRDLKPEIDNFLKGVPLNIHSIVYDVGQQKVIGDVGIAAIKEKVVRVNDFEMAEYRAKMLGVSVKDLLEQKAMELAFDYELPSV